MNWPLILALIAAISGSGCVYPSTRTSTTQADIHGKLQEIRFPHVKFENADVRRVAKWLTDESKRCDEARKGVPVILDYREFRYWRASYGPKITCDLRDIPMSETIRLLFGVANLHYRITDHGVVISPPIVVN